MGPPDIGGKYLELAVKVLSQDEMKRVTPCDSQTDFLCLYPPLE